MRGLADRRFIVTGAGRGIGLAVAKRLVALGGRVALLAQHADSADAAARELGAPERTVALAGDLADYETNQAIIEAAVDRLGGVDGLVNNAGWTLTRPFLEETPDYWERVLRVNLHAVIWTSRTVLAHWATRGQGGAIVNVVSDAGRVGMQGEAAYAAAKGGVIAFTKSLAQEMASRGIRLNAVAPGPTNTRVLEENMGGGPDAREKIARMIRRIPLKRIAEPDDIAAAIVFLLSDDAAYITGQTLSVSGGLTMV
jgi:2-hydroxycyclohexanecarboxyl-CoA dehydrogenase